PRLYERALFVLDQVLRRETERADVRRTIVDLAMKLGSYADAKAHLLVLKEKASADGELLHLLGSCEAATGKYTKAVEYLNQAIQLPRKEVEKEVESYVLLAAVLWRKLDDVKRADEIMRQLVATKESVPAYLARAVYLRERLRAEMTPK